MKMNRKLVACCAAVLCLGLTNSVRADDQNSSQNDATDQQYKQHQKHQGDKAGMWGHAPQTSQAQPTKFDKASQLIGMKVQNPQGEDLGDIKDIVINFERGSVAYAVLSSGGVLGVGEKLLAVPLSAFQRSPNQSALILNASQSNVSQAQGIGNNWPSAQNPSFGATPFWQRGNQMKNSQQPATQGQENQNEQNRLYHR